MSGSSRSRDDTSGLPVVLKAQAPRGVVDDVSAAVTPRAAKRPEDLGLQLRLEAGKTVLALEDAVVVDGVTIRRALFDVPDAGGPIDVRAGALPFVAHRLTLRAVELALTWEALRDEDALARHGLALVRERGRAGGLELVMTVHAATSTSASSSRAPLPLRARCLLAPVAGSGFAVVVHELISLAPLPRTRLEVAAALLDALRLPGGLPARSMVRRAEPFAAVCNSLLPAHGWLAPSIDGLVLHEAVVGKGEVVLRAWSGPAPEGWKVPRPTKDGPLHEAAFLADLADALATSAEREHNSALEHLPEPPWTSSAIPFIAEVQQADGRGAPAGDELLRQALARDEHHLGLRAAWAADPAIDDDERARRLMQLADAADEHDDPWVAGRAALEAARVREQGGDLEGALAAAVAALEADPSLAEAGMRVARLEARRGRLDVALAVGRAALDRVGTGSLLEPAAELEAADAFAVALADVARRAEGPHEARALLRRALRATERADALVALVELDVATGALDDAETSVARLLRLQPPSGELAAAIELAAGRVARARRRPHAALDHLDTARALAPDDVTIAIECAMVALELGELQRAAATIDPFVDDAGRHEAGVDEQRHEARCLAARIALAQAAATPSDAAVFATRARGWLQRLPAASLPRSEAARLDAEACALLGDTAPLARVLLQEADATSDRQAAGARRAQAAAHLLTAELVDEAAHALAQACLEGAIDAVGDVVASASNERLVVGLGAALQGAVDADGALARRQLAQRVAAKGHAHAAVVVLDGLPDVATREFRAACAADASDVDIELAERMALVDLVLPAARVTHLVRAAHLLEGVGRLDEAADAWERVAAEAGPVDLGAWLRVACHDPARLARAVALDDAPIHDVDVVALRQALPFIGPTTASRRVLEAIARRSGEIDDAARWLEAARAFAPTDAAAALIESARAHRRADWLLEGTARLSEAHLDRDALSACQLAIEAEPAFAASQDLALRAFDLAIAVDDADTIDVCARRLVVRTDIDDAVVRAVRTRQLDAHRQAASSPGRTAQLERCLSTWLDADVAAIAPLKALVELSVANAQANLAEVTARLRAACAHGIGSDALPLLSTVADAAASRSSSVERELLELMLPLVVDETHSTQTMRRLAALCVEANQPRRAIELLTALIDRMVASGEPSASIADVWRHIAMLEHEALQSPRAAATALGEALRLVPHDDDASTRLEALLNTLGDDVGLAAELVRQSGRLGPCVERSRLLLRAADASFRAGRLADARACVIRALRDPPLTPDVVDNALQLASQLQSRRFAIRVRLAAAGALLRDEPAEAARHAADAGGLLAGILHRQRLAIIAYEHADRAVRVANAHAEGYSHMLVELSRAVMDGAGAVKWLERLLAHAVGKERVRLFEARADVRSHLLHDDDGAIADRRAALAIDPTFAQSAHALSRQLKARGDLRGSIDVERRLIDGTVDGALRGLAYGRLALAAANDGLDDPAFLSELCATALTGHDDVEIHRLLLSIHERQGDIPLVTTSLQRVLERTPVAAERIRVGLRLADLQHDAGRVDDAITTLTRVMDDDDVRAAVAARHEHPLPPEARYDLVIAHLAQWLAQQGALGRAADVLLRGLSRCPDGPALQPANAQLEQAGAWLDDAGDGDNDDENASKALAVLCDAAESGGLSDDGETRRARLAEELAQPTIACAALEALIGRQRDVAHTLVRLARQAEAAGDLRRAVTAWQRWLAQADDDGASSTKNGPAVDESATIEGAWLEVERLALGLDADTLRQAREALVTLGVGTPAQQLRRALDCADDALDRHHDVDAAIRWLERARTIETSAELRARLLTLLRSSKAPPAAQLAVLEEMVAYGDALSAAESIEMVSLRLASATDPANRRSAVDDVVAAIGTATADSTAIDRLVEQAIETSPVAVGETLVIRGDEPASARLLDALVSSAVVDGPALELNLVVRLADAFPHHVGLQRAAAGRQRGAGHPGPAIDRLVQAAALISAADASSAEAAALLDDAAVVAVDAPGEVLVARLQALRPALQRTPERREQALSALRDADDWGAVATVLEDAVTRAGDDGGVDAAQRRRLRLQLVAVLREGLEDQASLVRAVGHLRALVVDDVHDREAWGELFECLESLGDGDGLQAALGARAAAIGSSTSLEARQLVRRRADILAGLKRPHEAIAALQDLRAGGDDDASLRALLLSLHQEQDRTDQGVRHTAAFLAAELAAASRADDARAVLALPADAVVASEPGIRVLAWRALLVDEGSAVTAAASIVGTAWSIGARGVVNEAVAVLESLAGDDARTHVLEMLVAGLGAEAGRLGSRGALDLADALHASSAVMHGAGAAWSRAFSRPSWARRVRTEGIGATDVDITRLDERAQLHATFRRAARLGDTGPLRATAAALGLPGRIVDVGAQATEHVSRPWRPSRLALAAALIRHGDPRADAAIEAVVTHEPESLGELARRVTALPMRPPRRAARLPWRLRLATSLPVPELELAQIAAAAHDESVPALEVEALDALAALRPLSPAELAARADAAWALQAPDAARWSSLAADAAMTEPALVESGLRSRRRCVELAVRSGDRATLAREVLALARQAPADASHDAIWQEARTTAEAAGLHDVVDVILAEAEARLDTQQARLAAVRERAALRVRRKDPAGAFRALVDAAQQLPDGQDRTELRQSAWRIATDEGLIDLAVEVLDDPLAEAGVLALLGKTRDALAVASRGEGPAFDWLRAELAARAGDAAAEASALAALVAAGSADDGVTERVIASLRHRGESDEATRQAIALCRRGLTARRVSCLVESLAGASDHDVLADAVRVMLDGEPARVGQPLAIEVYAAVLERAHITRRPALARDALVAIADVTNTDESFIAVAAHEASFLDDDSLIRTLRKTMSRPAVLAGVADRVALHESAIERFAVACETFVGEGLAGDVVVALGASASRPVRLTEVLAAGLAALSRPAEAAAALLEAARADGSRRRLVLAATRLLLDHTDAIGASRALRRLEAADCDNEVRQLAHHTAELAARAGGFIDAARLAAHVARLTNDDALGALALRLADAAGGDTAVAIASWRLRRRDIAALPVLAAHTAEHSPARSFFAAWQALRSGARSFPSSAPADFARLTAHNASNDAPAPPSPLPPTTPLERARRGPRTSRQAAWRELAGPSATLDNRATGRLLRRAGVALEDAPLEVRLAADPALADPASRATAIAASIADVPPARRVAVVAAFDDAVASGGSTPAERLAVDVAANRSRPGLSALDQVAVGIAVDVRRMVKELGRSPSGQERAAAAAVLVAVGRTDLAMLVQPAPYRPWEQGRERLEAFRTASDGDVLQSIGRLRLSQLSGARDDIEERIIALAAQVGRTDLVAESILRRARLADDVATRAAHLGRHAELVLPTDGAAAHRSALAAYRLAPSAALAVLVSSAAEAKKAPADLEAALAAQLEWASAADVPDLVRRRATVLARRMLRPEDAVELLDAHLATTPHMSLFEAKASIQDELLAQPRDAAITLLTSIRAGWPAALDQRDRWRRRAASLLVRQGDVGSIDLAVSVLCALADDGDAEALAEAEALARSRGSQAAVAEVLERRLGATEELGARRVLVREQTRVLRELGDRIGALALMEAQVRSDLGDTETRLMLASWYLEDRRIHDAAAAFEDVARVPGLTPADVERAARQGAVLRAALGELERAGPLAELALAAGSTSGDVLSVAEAWHRSHNRWAAVDDILGRALANVSDRAGQAHLWAERARLLSERLGDREAAGRAAMQALELVAHHEGALAVMWGDAAKTDSWDGFRRALQRAIDATTDRRRRVKWLCDLAAIDADQLGDLAAAEASIDRALEIAPDHLECLVLKANVMVRGGHVDGVAPLMERIERMGGASLPASLQLVRGDALLLTGDRNEAIHAFMQATDDPVVAARAWDRLLDMHDGSPAALPYFESARRATLADDRRLSLLRREIRVRQKLGEDVVAAATAVLALAPGDDDALAIVHDALSRRRRQRDFLPFFVAWARAAADGPQQAEKLVRVAVFCIDELGYEAAAREYFEEALGLDPSQPTALVRLADIAWASRDDERALQLLDRMPPEMWAAAPTEDGRPRAVAELLMRRARCAWSLGHADTRERLRQVLRVNARYVPALELLARLALDTHDDDGAELALEALAQAVAPTDDPVRLASALLDLANLRLRRGRPDEAVIAAERALELNPTSLAVLEAVGDTRDAAGRYADAAEAWRRVAALRTGPDRVRALELRVRSLQAASLPREVFDTLNDLYTETGDPAHKAAAADVARRAGLHDAKRAGGTVDLAISTDVAEDTMVSFTLPLAAGGGGALAIQLHANLESNDPGHALTLAKAAAAVGPLDAECTRLACNAAVRVGAWADAVAFAEARLPAATDPAEVLGVGLAAGRIARDHLRDDDRAAALLYQAHQANAEDLDVRFELTSVYVRIPRLASHATTGILQLLRRTPTDARVFQLAADLAEQQGQAERAMAMKAVAQVLVGTGAPEALMLGRVADERALAMTMPMDREVVASRLAPTGWGSPLHRLLVLLGPHLEEALGGPAPPPGVKPLVQASPRTTPLVERIERLLPGRPLQVVMADVDRPLVCVGGVPQVVVPRELIVHDGALTATVARGVAVVRLSLTVSELVRPGQEQGLLDLLRAALLGQGQHERSRVLLRKLQADEQAAAVALARQVFADPVDMLATLFTMMRAADRIALVTTGSALAALQASALPTLVKEPPARAMLLLQGSARALDLCSFAARDNAWLVRRQHLL